MTKKKRPRNSDDFRDPTWPKGLTRRNDCYRFRRTVKGKQISMSLGDVSERVAIEKTNELNTQIAAGIDVSIQAARSRTTVEQFVRGVMETKRAQTSERTARRYAAVFANFLYWLKEHHGSVPLVSVDHNMARDYLLARARGPVIPNGIRKGTRPMSGRASPWTMRMERDCLAGLFKEAVKRKLIHENPFADVKAPKPTHDQITAAHRILSSAEAKSLVETARKFDAQARQSQNAKFADILLFMLRTGMRDDEVRHLEWTDLDFDQALIHVRLKHVVETRQGPIPSTAIRKLGRLMKGKKPSDPVFASEREASSVRLFLQAMDDLLTLPCSAVDLDAARITFTTQYDWQPKASSGTVPMCKTVTALLLRIKKESAGVGNFVFAHHDGGRCRLHLLDLLKKAQKEAGIRGRLRIHDLRHTCAATLRRMGVPLETIMGILRHANIRETLVYAPYSAEEGKRAIRLLDDKA